MKEPEKKTKDIIQMLFKALHPQRKKKSDP